MANIEQEPKHLGSAMVDTNGTDHGVTAFDRNAPAIFPQWDTKSVSTFATWDIKLRTNIDHRTFDGFIDSSRPSLEEESSRTTRMSAGDKTVRLADIKVAIELWDKYDKLLFTTLLNSTILSERQNKHTLERFYKKKEGHNLYIYLTAHLNDVKTSDKLKCKDDLDAIEIPADASSVMIKQTLESVEDLWPKVEGLVQTQKAMISHCIGLFPEEHCANKYLTNLQFAIDAGTSGDFKSMEFFIEKIVEFVAIEHRRHPPSMGGAAFGFVPRGGRGRADGRLPGGGRSQGRGRGLEQKCRRCDMSCCGGDECCVCDTTDEQVRAMKVSGGAKFLIFVLRKWKQEKKLSSMKGIVPPHDYFEVQKKAAIEFKERAASGKAGMPCVGDDSFDYSNDQTMWDTLGDLEEKEALARAFGGSVGAPVIDAGNIRLDEAGNLIPPWGASVPPVKRDRSIGSLLADDEVAELRDSVMETWSQSEADGVIPVDPMDSDQPPVIAKDRTLTSYPEPSHSLRPASTVPFDISSPPPAAAVRERPAVPTDPRVLLADMISSQASAKELSEAGDDVKISILEEQLAVAVARAEKLIIAASVQRDQYEKSRAADKATITTMQSRIGWWEEACAFRTAEQAAILRNCVAERDAARQALEISSVALVKEKVESNTSLSRFKLALIKRISSSHADRKSYLKLFNALILLALAMQAGLARVALSSESARKVQAACHYVSFMVLHGSVSFSRALLSLGESLLARFQLAYAPLHASFMMVRRAPGIKNSAILMDGGATDFMTNSLQGLIGRLTRVAGESFITAAGPKSFDTSGFFRKVVFGMNGVSVEVPAVMWYDKSLPFDIYGLPALRKQMGAVYIDADSPVAPTISARLRLAFVGDLELELGRTKNGLEWLSYDAPRVVALSVWGEDDEFALSGRGNAGLSVMSSGAGMGPLAKNLTELEAAILDHTRRGHPSLKRAAFSRKVTVGGLTVTKEGTRQLAILGCDVCNAYKIKLVDPKAKHSPSENPDNLTIRIMLYDVFGKVPYPSAQYKFQYAHLFVSKLKTIGWLKGSKSLDSTSVVDVHQKIYVELTAYFPNEKIQIIRMDSFSTHRGQEMTKFFLSALQHAQFTPPGQHAFLGDLERWWYPLFLRVLVGLRQSGANRIHWFSAMADALDKECALCNDLGSDAPTCGYQRAFGVVHDVSDMFSFYAPCRFSLDKAGLASKWMERARAGFWVGRDVSFVMNGTVGSAIIWDGNIHRTVVHRYFVQEGGFLNITAPGNRLLPSFPAAGPVGSVVPDVANVDAASAGPHSAPIPTPFDIYKAAMERSAAGVPFANDEVLLSGAVSSGVAMSDGTIIAASDVVLSPSLAAPVSEPFVPLSLQRPKRVGADTHRAPAVACLLCDADCYMELCCKCDADWAVNGGVTLALSHGGLPQSDFVDGLSPLDAYGKFSSSPHNFSPSSAVPTMRSVLSLMSGDYYAADGYAAQMRAIDRGVIQVDNDVLVGGGVKADMTSNATLAFCNLVLDSRLVSGVVSAQRCGSGSVVRFRVDESNPDLPEPSRDVFSPDGKADLLPLYKKEIHTSQLLSYRVTKLSADCYWMGGWFLAECPAMRGDMHSTLFYDPAFATHSSVQRNAYWLRLWKATGAICVSLNLCVLRSKYPPKAEDIMFSPNLAGALHQKLKSLACPHPTGTHVVQFSKEPSELKKSATWLPELASILVEATAGLTPMGGASLNLGVDDVVDFAMNHLRTRDMEHYIALESSSLRLQHPSSTVVDAKVMAAAGAIRCEDASYGDDFSVACPWMRYEVEGDIDQDPRLEPVLYGINCSGGDVSLDRETWEFYSNGKSVFVTLAAPIVPHPPPQTEAALMADPNRDIYLATDQNEIDTLCAIPVWEEVWADPKEVSRPWRLRFVRSLKESAKTGEQTPRSRLVMIGPLHEAKIEFDRADSPTPMWATTVLVMTVGTVRGMQQLQFDLKQFFQHTDISTPSGELIGIPPRRYQAQRGNLRLYWSFLKWIQGARGAGRASHLFIVSVILDRGSGLRFFQSMHDPCYFRHIEEDGEVHFTLHVDDGIGWASNKALGKKLEDWLRKCWPELKWFWEWADVMGFDVNTNPTQRTLGFTAPKHISALRALVASDCSFTPKSPSAADIGTLYACEVPDDKGSLEHLLFVNRVSFCQQGLGSLRHISKIRCDIAGAIGFQSRFSHAPQVDLPKHIKYTCLYLLGTIDFGPTFGGPSVVFKDLSLREKLDDDYELDVDGHKLYFYHCVLDGALSIDRSRCGIMHMFAGGCFNGLSYTQHSIAKDANDSEVFTASSGCAQSIPYRGILREMGVNMAIATPIFSDSRSTRLISISAAAHKQSIYLARRVLFMREGISEGEYHFLTVLGKNNPADGLTKYITLIAFLRSRDYMGVMAVAKSLVVTTGKKLSV